MKPCEKFEYTGNDLALIEEYTRKDEIVLYEWVDYLRSLAIELRLPTLFIDKIFPGNPFERGVSAEEELRFPSESFFRASGIKGYIDRWFNPYGSGNTFSKGGLRIDLSVNRFWGRLLSMGMVRKHLLGEEKGGVPMGGSKSGITFNPLPNRLGEKPMSVLRELLWAFINTFPTVIENERIVFAPDLNTTPEDMATLVDAYSRMASKGIPIHVTRDVLSIAMGKPVKPVWFFGLEGRETGTGDGIMDFVEFLMEDGLIHVGDRVNIHGFGNVGRAIGDQLHKRGFRITCIADISAAAFDEKGIAYDHLKEHMQSCRQIAGFTGAEIIPPGELFSRPGDILIICSNSNVLGAHNIGTMYRYRMVIEGGNSPLEPYADAYCRQEGIPVLYDCLANRAGAFLSYLEMLFVNRYPRPTKNEIEGYRKAAMRESYNIVTTYMKENPDNLKELTYRKSGDAYVLKKMNNLFQLKPLVD